MLSAFINRNSLEDTTRTFREVAACFVFAQVGDDASLVALDIVAFPRARGHVYVQPDTECKVVETHRLLFGERRLEISDFVGTGDVVKAFCARFDNDDDFISGFFKFVINFEVCFVEDDLDRGFE